MTSPTREQLLADIAQALRAPLVPTVFQALAGCDRYLDVVWPQLAPSVETSGFRDSALYLGDMALDAARAELEPAQAREVMLAESVDPRGLEALVATLDVFQWVTPQALLLCAALSEAADHARVGELGRPEPRPTLPREVRHVATPMVLAPEETPPLPTIAAALQLVVAPDLYRVLAALPAAGTSCADSAWMVTQHLSALPSLRRRGRALYYYARSAARYLAYPLTADPDALAAAGVGPAAFAAARAVLADALPATATMLVHCAALRVALGLTAFDVSGDEPAR